MDESDPDPHRVALAIDVGGTTLAAGLVTTAGIVVRRAERPTPTAGAGQGDVVTAALLALIDEVLGPGSDDGPTPLVTCVGLACAGPIDATAGTVRPVNIPAWRDEPLVASVAAHLSGPPVVLVNDAVAMTVGEHWRGAARGTDDVLGVVVSTGVGGGLVLAGRPRLGPTANAGHVGHTVVVVDGEPCPCGGRGCVETRGSATAMVRAALAGGWRPPGDGAGPGAGSADRSPAGRADGRALAAAAAAGDPRARAAVERGAAALAAGFVSAAALLELDLIVVGGGFAASGPVLFEPLRRHVATRSGMPFLQRLRVVPAELGRDAGLVGAAALALRRRDDVTAGSG
jgi:glucokinase